MNKIKDGYLKVVDFVEYHPHKAFWIGMAVLILSFWF